MSVDRIWRTVHDVNVSTVRLPSRHRLLPLGFICKMYVGVRDAPVVLHLESVFRSARSWIAAFPERTDELFALRIVRQAQKLRVLLGSDD
jgi:hypothetical protein